MNDANSANPERPPGDSGTDADSALAARAEAQAEELEALRRTLASASADAHALQRTLRTRQRELDQLRATLSVALGTLREQLERVERSAAWRYGHGATKRLARLRRRRIATAGGVVAAIGQVDRILQLIGAESAQSVTDSDRTAPPPQPAHRGTRRVATREDELLLGRRIRDLLGPAATGGTTPSVTVVVVSRSRERAVRILERLVETDYPALEVMLVDNASPSGEVSSLALSETGLTLGTERLDSALSFAQASNKGAEHAGAELLLFLNDDIHPTEPGWLSELVSTLIDGEAQIAGATLVDPAVDAAGAGLASGWTLEQRGIVIGLDAGSFLPIRREAGADLFGPRFGIDSRAVAVSGACLLISRAQFEALGGFDTGYQFGLEDIDFCLRARAHGHAIACSGRSIVVHEGSSSQTEAGREFRRINRDVNHRRFRQLWGPALRRDRLDGLLRGDSAWGGGPHLAVARTSNDPGAGWGDHYTASELGEAAAALGWRVSYLAQKDEAPPVIPDDVDVAVLLTDRWDARLFPDGVLICAWIRNWTERWLTRPWLDRYDVLLASSERSAELLREVTGRPVELFPLATNQRRFRSPPPGSERALDWVLAANRWGKARALEAALSSRGHDAAAIYGLGWEECSAVRALTRGPIEYERLPAVYAAAKVALDDTAEPTLAYDAVNSRVFDALACGALVLTNCAAGVRELFDEEFPTWSSPEQVDGELGRLLAAPQELERLVRRYRQTVLENHTYEHRARHLRRIAAAHNERLSFCLKIGAPDWEQAERWGDLYFATGLGRALRRLGHSWRVDVLPEWQDAASATYDVVVHLRGRSEYSPSPGQCNVLWLISHPETFNDALADGFDLICVASSPFAEELSGRIGTPVTVLEQATDPRVFFPEHDSGLAHELVFVGNSRGVRRKLLDDLLPTDRDLGLWGSGWKGTPAERHLIGEHVPNDELRRVYSSASIVLCDHWPDMRAAGFRSNRLYDALACGAIVVSDRVAGLDGSLGEAVITYDDRAELTPLLERLLRDRAERDRRARGARARILEGETFDDRARKLVRWLYEAL